MSNSSDLWFIWALAAIACAALLGYGLVYGGGLRAHFAPGEMTSGHHQIELACDACHTTPFAGRQAIQEACVDCHGAALNAAKDSHPAKKFTDPRNADRLAKLKATECITCHTEHRPEITHAMGVTLPTDYCALCHAEIGQERPSHLDAPFTSCLNSGCHNFHDNTALYEDFLERHANKEDFLFPAVVKRRAAAIERAATGAPITSPLAANAPARQALDSGGTQDWLASAHAKGGVNCAGCHAPNATDEPSIAALWTSKPDHRVCATCHGAQADGFVRGKHGMRLAAGMTSTRRDPLGLFETAHLGPMRTDKARLPMQATAQGRDVDCVSCHQAHAFDTRAAEVEACLGCHADQHSASYAGSPHHALWLAELDGQAPAGSGVTCAGCHMPRITHENPDTGEYLTIVQHNQSDTLRPSSKMIRPVCMNCHGLAFAIDALADRALVARNFTGRPSARVESIEWVKRRLAEHEGRSTSPPAAK